MTGVRDVMPLIPPVLISQWSITTPVNQTIADCRIMDSNDATYGTIGWLPPRDGSPWAVLEVAQTKETTPEPNRVRVEAAVTIFLAIEHADAPAVIEDYHDRALAYWDSLRQVVAANRRLSPGALTLYPTAGDVRWELVSGKTIPDKALYGGGWRGVEYTTLLSVTVAVNYQA